LGKKFSLVVFGVVFVDSLLSGFFGDDAHCVAMCYVLLAVGGGGGNVRLKNMKKLVT
jgi:hypothetical protein